MKKRIARPHVERIGAVLIGAGLAMLVSGCDVQAVRGDVIKALDAAIAAMMGRVPDSQKKSAATPASQAQSKLREEAQLLHEMFQVVLLREPFGPDEFAGYVNMLSQGGSLEGIYNGFVNSKQFHDIEESPAPAYPTTVKVFAQQISELQKDVLASRGHAQLKPTDLGVNAPFSPEKYQEIYGKASFYELKRLLGNEALKLVEAKFSKGDSRDELAQWYANWVVQEASLGVDFGVPLRNRADAAFHRKWVMTLPADEVSDRVTWEVLNRLHRLLNAAEANGANGTQKKGSK